ncbi:DUF6187 family protein [Streptomyces sp. NPDC097619]|uniref:DUF6187 family protein n=1 Tax=Streptomyces sp. NPDC097619 TaxID=3157228 RepID=UPI00332C71D4
MSDPTAYDSRFALTPVDGSALTETGIMLMGLDADRLLAGLGLAALTEDPAQVLLAVDRARHGVAAVPDFDGLLAHGLDTWRRARPALAAADPTRPGTPTPLRPAWERALRLALTAGPEAPGPATAAHLATCWLRREETDRFAARPPAPTGT